MLYRYLLYRLCPNAAVTDLPGVSCCAADAALVRELFAGDRRKKLFLRFLAQGHLGVMIHDVHGGWQGYAWMSTPASAPPMHLPLSFRGLGLYWIHYCRTRSMWRGQGYYQAAMQALIRRALQLDGQATIQIDTTAGNRPSRQAIARMGFAPCGVALTLDAPGLPTVGRWFRSWSHPRGG